jgi:hypothetical protein
MPKKTSALPALEEPYVRQLRLVRLCGVLWKIMAFLATAVLLNAVTGLWTTWLLGGTLPVSSPLGYLLAAWPVSLPTGGCLLLFALLIRLLASRSVSRPLPAEQQNAVNMLKRLARSYDDVLTQSLQGVCWIEPGFLRKSGTIQRDADRLRLPAHLQDQMLAPGTSIQQVYTGAPGGLLILGESGAGKSTLLLSLAMWLVEQAQQDLTQPFPILLRLSSWAAKRLPLEEWACEQMAQVYNIAHQVCKQWLQQERIILLLDECDDMKEEMRADCLAAVNAYHHAHLVPLVVCCRCSAYEKAAQQERLAFQDAVLIQPLSSRQIDTCLAELGKPCEALRVRLQTDPVLQNLATTPLMLNVLIRTYRATPLRGLAQREEVLRRQVWAAYVRQMIAWKQDEKQDLFGHYYTWLHWLASQLRRRGQTIFYLEHLQPDWLPASQQSIYDWLAVLLPGALIGSLAGLLSAPLLVAGDPILLLQYSVLSAFLGALGSMSPQQHQVGNRRRAVSCNAAISGVLGLLWSTAFFFERDAGWFFARLAHCVLLIGPALLIGLSCFCLLSVFPRMAPGGARTGAGHMERTWRSCLRRVRLLHGKRALLIAALLGIGGGLSFGLVTGMEQGGWAGLNAGLSAGLHYGLSYGLLSLAISALSATVRRGVHLAERLEWTWGRIQRRLLPPRRLRSPLALVSFLFLLVGASQSLGVGFHQGLTWALSQGLSWGLLWGPGCWLLPGMFQAVSSRRVEDSERRRGVRDSLSHSLVMGSIGALLAGCVSILVLGLSYRLHDTLAAWSGDPAGSALASGQPGQALNSLWLFVLSAGLLVVLLSGGLAVLRHCILRLLLRQAGLFPWKAQPFLQGAVTRILLLPMGGGYIFAHRQLCEYFAETPADGEKPDHWSAERSDNPSVAEQVCRKER